MESQCNFSNFGGHVEGLVLCCFLRCVAYCDRKPAGRCTLDFVHLSSVLVGAAASWCRIGTHCIVDSVGSHASFAGQYPTKFSNWIANLFVKKVNFSNGA